MFSPPIKQFLPKSFGTKVFHLLLLSTLLPILACDDSTDPVVDAADATLDSDATAKVDVSPDMSVDTTVDLVIEATCSDGIKNGDEADIDCGGAECEKCALTSSCRSDDDCQDSVCDTTDSNTCEPLLRCGNGKVEAAEECDDGTGLGNGTCTSWCQIPTSCTTGAECASGVCIGTCIEVPSSFIKPSTVRASSFFGANLAIFGDLMVVGARFDISCSTGVGGPQENMVCPKAGAAYLFRRDASGWKQEAYLKASNTQENALFGTSVAITEDAVAISSRDSSCGEGVNAEQATTECPGSGAVHIFRSKDGVWAQEAYIKASNNGSGDGFGESLAFDGDRLVVGTPWEASCADGVDGVQTNDCPYSGAAYIFDRGVSGWKQTAYLKASNSEEEDEFGSNVSLDGTTVVVGAPSEGTCGMGVNQTPGDRTCRDSGAVYVFEFNEGLWMQTAYVKSSNSGQNDNFGESISVDGQRFVVGARSESSCGTGNAADPLDDGCTNAGAAYVFEKSADAWVQKAYLKSSNTDANDVFGRAVSLNGDYFAMSARQEGSCATGIDGDQTDNACGNAGAVYLFAKNGETWEQSAYIKASNSGAGDKFGAGISLNGSTLVVGASDEGSCSQADPTDDTCNRAGAIYVWDSLIP